MAQLPQDRVSGSSANSTAAPATLSLAELLQALVLGLTVGEGQSAHNPLSFNPPPLSPPSNISSSQPASGAGTGGVTTENASVGPNADDRSGVIAGKAKAVEPEVLPCAMCAARGCLPPPSSQEEESPVVVDKTTTQSIDLSSEKWYVVTAGRHVGVFSGWENVAPLVVRVSGAVYSKYPSRIAADLAFGSALQAGSVRVLV